MVRAYADVANSIATVLALAAFGLWLVARALELMKRRPEQKQEQAPDPGQALPEGRAPDQGQGLWKWRAADPNANRGPDTNEEQVLALRDCLIVMLSLRDNWPPEEVDDFVWRAAFAEPSSMSFPRQDVCTAHRHLRNAMIGVYRDFPDSCWGWE